ncbi:MAG: thiamine biosynthesis protein ThiS [Verrucomicrobiales bacterium]|jgi:thiamine biosynthesis protein ThiS
MKITLNGKFTEEFPAKLTVTDLLEKLGFARQPVLVELNEVALRPREFDAAMIEDGARLEIIRIAAGG